MSNVELSEREIQQSIVHGLSVLKYRVFSTSRVVRRCWKCGTFPPAGFGDGVSKGLADLMVGREEWGPVLMPLEVKGTKTRLSPEQQDLLDRGLIFVARSWEDAIAAVTEFERRFGFKEVARRVS